MTDVKKKREKYIYIYIYIYIYGHSLGVYAQEGRR